MKVARASRPCLSVTNLGGTPKPRGTGILPVELEGMLK